MLITLVGLVAFMSAGVNAHFVCRGDGFFPDTDNCRKYHWCHYGQYWHMSCPAGTTFSSKHRRCDWGDEDCKPKPDKKLPSWPRDFKWSYSNIPRGYHCIQIREPGDRGSWHNNYFCWRDNKKNPQFRWSWAGPHRDMRCTLVNEPADHHVWRDNYICVPKNSPYKLKWSYRGKIKGLDCIQWKEPSDRHTWNDNYLCGTDKEEPEPEPTVSPDCRDDWPECKKHPEMCEDEEIASLVCQRTCKRCK